MSYSEVDAFLTADFRLRCTLSACFLWAAINKCKDAVLNHNFTKLTLVILYYHNRIIL